MCSSHPSFRVAYDWPASRNCLILCRRLRGAMRYEDRPDMSSGILARQRVFCTFAVGHEYSDATRSRIQFSGVRLTFLCQNPAYRFGMTSPCLAFQPTNVIGSRDARDPTSRCSSITAVLTNPCRRCYERPGPASAFSRTCATSPSWPPALLPLTMKAK